MPSRKFALILGVASLAAVFLGSGMAQPARVFAIATPPASPDWQIIQKQSTDSGTKPDYTVKISQPVLSSTSGKADAFNKAVNAFISGALADFKKSAADSQGGPAGAVSTLDIGYDVFATANGLISVRFMIGSYIQGAAHPLTVTYTLNYRLSAGQVLKLADLFKPGAKYLVAIAKFSSDELKRENRLAFPEGAAVKEENYSNWTVEHGGLLFAFDPYQVGPYAQGPSEVFIPYTALGDLLADDVYFMS